MYFKFYDFLMDLNYLISVTILRVPPTFSPNSMGHLLWLYVACRVKELIWPDRHLGMMWKNCVEIKIF